MHIDTPSLFNEIPSDDDFTPGIEGLVDVIRTTTDRLALPALADLLTHPHPSVRAAAVEALEGLHPSSLELRRQLSPVAVMRVRDALGRERSRKTRKARGTLGTARDREDCDEDSDE